MFKNINIERITEFLNDLENINLTSETNLLITFVKAYTSEKNNHSQITNAFTKWIRDNAERIKTKDEKIFEIETKGVLGHILNNIGSTWVRIGYDDKTAIWQWVQYFAEQ